MHSYMNFIYFIFWHFYTVPAVFKCAKYNHYECHLFKYLSLSFSFSLCNSVCVWVCVFVKAVYLCCIKRVIRSERHQRALLSLSHFSLAHSQLSYRANHILVGYKEQIFHQRLHDPPMKTTPTIHQRTTATIIPVWHVLNDIRVFYLYVYIICVTF